MKTPRQVRGPVTAAVLCAALAGCGTATVSSSAGAGAPAGTATSTATQAGTIPSASSGSAVGCGAVNQATMVTIHRTMHLVEPARAGALSTTQRKTALVQALLRDFCDAVSHPAKPGGLVHCPAALGMNYTGTFYQGSRSLATFVYGASGCQTLSVTSPDGQRQSTMLYGTAAAAAPHLQADMAAVLGVPKYAVSAPQTPMPVNAGGPKKL